MVEHISQKQRESLLRATLAHESGHDHEQEFWLRILRTVVADLAIDDVLRIFGDALKAIREQQIQTARFAIQERIESLVKALHKPIISIPQSLRPIEFVTL